MARIDSPTVVIVPGLREHAPGHWQTLLARELPHVRVVAPLGREDLDCGKRVKALEEQAQGVEGPIVIVAHSAGTITVAHWAAMRSRRVVGALLVTPPDFERELPEGYPRLEELRAAGWLPVPRAPLPFSSIVAASSSDPLATPARVWELANAWGSELIKLGDVGHMNPASGFGAWKEAVVWIDALITMNSVAREAE